MSKSTKVKVLCRTCKHPTNHEILFRKDSSGETEDGDIRWWDSNQVIQCCGCDEITFRRTAECTEDIDPYTGQLDTTETLFPSRTEGRPPMEGFDNFPTKTRRIYVETLKALNHNALILAAIGLRALIESICIEQKTKAKTLAKGIDELADSGLLSKKQVDFLHAHRFMGNVAAHEIVAPKATELVAALDIAETLLKTIYILPEVAEIMKPKSPASHV
ncbi:DUF4145 domain-containing protein [Methylotenera sp.]|uniref:DUF4145 domain-containing protein n=1 Tax=Methylotenera sp. TaxID=2051956 RepID=UPI002487C387|nr:DUF4145 domain-containing protein [Methylotenera sp.]MDI1298792.1 DUF4145 domain-containing protein [Methylotenera sp.]